VLVKELLEICAVEEGCLLQQKYGGDGTEKSA